MKNQIDDLFARKLKNFEIEPSSNAWERLQIKQQKRKTVFWWQRGAWAAAASVVLVLGAMWLSQTQDVTKPALATVTTPPKVEPKTIEPATLAAETNLNKNTKANGIVEPTKNYPITTLPEKNIANVNTKNKSVEIPNNIVKTPNNEEKTLANNDIKPLNDNGSNNNGIDNVETKHALSLPTTTTKSTTIGNTIAERKIEMVLPEISMPTAETKATLAQNNENIKEALNQKRNGRFAKVFKQLKNLKEGEKVDWHEVGFDPNPILAKVGKSI